MLQPSQVNLPEENDLNPRATGTDGCLSNRACQLSQALVAFAASPKRGLSRRCRRNYRSQDGLQKPSSPTGTDDSEDPQPPESRGYTDNKGVGFNKTTNRGKD